MHRFMRSTVIVPASIFSCFLLFSSCEKEFVTLSDAGITAQEPGSTDTTGNGGTGTATVLFSRDIQPIFKSNCLSCHDAGTKFQFDSKHAYSTLINGGYVSTSAPATSKFFNNSKKGHPDDYLTPSEHKLFVTWMTEGALNN